MDVPELDVTIKVTLKPIQDINVLCLLVCMETSNIIQYDHLSDRTGNQVWDGIDSLKCISLCVLNTQRLSITHLLFIGGKMSSL